MQQRPQRKRRLNKESRETELLDTAAEVFREKGYQLASTAEIAERAGVVEGTIYRYFSSKHELLNKVVERAYEKSIADFATHLEGISGTWNQLRYLIWRHLKTIQEDPALARLVQYDIKTDPNYRNTAVFDLNRTYTRRTTGIIEAAMASGEFNSDIPSSVVRDMVYGCIDHHCWSYLRGERSSLDVNTIADQITELVYRALSCSDAGEGPACEALSRIDARLAHIEALIDR